MKKSKENRILCAINREVCYNINDYALRQVILQTRNGK